MAVKGRAGGVASCFGWGVGGKIDYLGVLSAGYELPLSLVWIWRSSHGYL
jgi:hypothetical protein